MAINILVCYGLVLFFINQIINYKIYNKMETKFTKGEWRNISRGGTLRRIQDEQGRDICDTYSFMSCISEEEQQSNAKLISAAPDLLEALINIENDDNSIPKEIWDMRNAAIKKALG